jgi:hypothetical protein
MAVRYNGWSLVADHIGDASCFRNIATFSFVIFISDKSCFAVEIQQKFIVMTALLILLFDTCQQIVCNACTTFIFNNDVFEHCCLFSLTCWCSFLIGLSKVHCSYHVVHMLLLLLLLLQW